MHQHAGIILATISTKTHVHSGAIMCLRGSRSTAGHPLKDFDFILAGTEGRLPLTD